MSLGVIVVPKLMIPPRNYGLSYINMIDLFFLLLWFGVYR